MIGEINVFSTWDLKRSGDSPDNSNVLDAANLCAIMSIVTVLLIAYFFKSTGFCSRHIVKSPRRQDLHVMPIIAYLYKKLLQVLLQKYLHDSQFKVPEHVCSTEQSQKSYIIAISGTVNMGVETSMNLTCNQSEQPWIKPATIKPSIKRRNLFHHKLPRFP